MQVYKGLEIITNKHPLKERDNVNHHVMDHVNWNEEYFMHRFAREANKAIDDVHKRNKVPIIVGGTHYYLQTLLFRNKLIGDGDFESESEEIELPPEQKAILDGPTIEIFDYLKQVDPIIAEKFHPQDRRKLRRALEIYFTKSRKPSELYQEQKHNELEDSSLKYNTLLFWVYSNPEILKQRLDARVDTMISHGAISEAQEMYDFYQKMDPQPDCTSGIWQVIGFKEFFPWLQSGERDPKLLSEGIERMKIRTRQYAKYQVKWIKKLLGIELSKESRFNYKYGGRMYILDATDLAQWDNAVKERGILISREFLSKGPNAVTSDTVPPHLESILQDVTQHTDFKSNKILGAENNWKHYQCPICKDKHGKGFVAVGEDNWKLHMQSRRHRRQKYLLEKQNRKMGNITRQT